MIDLLATRQNSWFFYGLIMSKVYITGASGFLGKHLTRKLKSKDVITIPHEQIPKTKLEPFDEFYFLSTYGNMYNHDDGTKIFKANVGDLISILDQLATREGFKSFVFMSTSSVRLKIQTMYSRSKRAAEELLLSFMERYSFPVCIIRPFSITGVGEQERHLIPTLIRSCISGHRMNFVSGPAHDFIDVEDVVNGMLSLSSNSARGIFELGTGKQTTNDEVKDLVEEVTGKKAKINKVDSLRSYDTKDWVSTNFKARGYGWLPKKTLKQSIKEMVEAYKKYLDMG